MNKPKFDGPSFINPQHTSYGLNSGSYQQPQINSDVAKKDSSNGVKYTSSSSNKLTNGNPAAGGNKKGPRGGWEDDEETNTTIKSTFKRESTKNPNISSTGYNSNQNTGNTANTADGHISQNVSNSSSNYVNYWDAENTRKIQTSTLSVEYETKLIDDILKPTGVAIKPSDNQIKEFLKRLKSLNKEIVLNILFERIRNYEQMTDANQIKTLMKSLYIVIAIINEKIEGFVDYFNENQSIFKDIQLLYNSVSNSSSKKIGDLCDEILDLINGGKSNKVKDKRRSENTLIDFKKEYTFSKSSGTTPNSNQEFKKPPGIVNVEDSNSNSDKNSNFSQETKPKFNFIKKKTTNDSMSVNEGAYTNDQENEIVSKKIEAEVSSLPSVNPPPQKFNFIKSKKVQNENADSKKTSSNNIPCTNTMDFNLLSSELNKAFSESKNSATTNPNFNWGIQETQNYPNNIPNNPNPYDKQTNITYGINFNPQHNLIIPDRNKNYDLIFNDDLLNSPSPLESAQQEKQQEETNKKDHFDFVNELMKPKK